MVTGHFLASLFCLLLIGMLPDILGFGPEEAMYILVRVDEGHLQFRMFGKALGNASQKSTYSLADEFAHKSRMYWT